MTRATVVALALIVGACGARTGIDAPPRCDSVEDCPPVPFCGPIPICSGGFCGTADPRVCDDGMACTDDHCDAVAEDCAHTIRDLDADGYGDGSCGGDDCDDSDPAIHPGVAERCTGSRDEDCDALSDCSDPDCRDDSVCAPCVPESCANGGDDDCDELVDCDDSDCRTHPACCLDSEAVCTDTVDEDCDGLVDCLDIDCAAEPTCCSATEEICNGLDDDCDGVADDGLGCYFLNGEPIAAVQTDECGRDWYSYGSPDIASANTEPEVRRPDAVAFMVHEGPGSCGASVALIADATNDGDGGRLEATFTISPSAAGGVLVSDDRGECSYSSGTGAGECSWRWESCCTDGMLLGAFTADFCVEVTAFSASGVSELAGLDGLGATRPLTFGAPVEVCGQIRAAVP